MKPANIIIKHDNWFEIISKYTKPRLKSIILLFGEAHRNGNYETIPTLSNTSVIST